MITAQSLPNFILMLSALTLGAFVFFKNWRGLVNRAFLCVCLSIAIWTFGFALTITSNNIDSATFWGKFLYIGGIFIPIFFNRFVLALINQYPKSKLFLASEILLCGFLLFLLKIGWLIEGVTPSTIYNYYDVPGKAFFLYIFFSSAIFFMLIIN